jgi:N-acetylneuraminic acid mutarotase
MMKKKPTVKALSVVSSIFLVLTLFFYVNGKANEFSYMHSANAEINGALLASVASGDNSSASNSTVSSGSLNYKYSLGSPMPTPRSEAAIANIGTNIYVLGGSPGTKDTVEVYDSLKDSWISSTDGKDNGDSTGSVIVPPLPVAVNHAAAASYNGKIYLVGGFMEDRIPSNKLFIYDPTTNKWQPGADMPTARAALTVNFVNGTLYAIGGTNLESKSLSTNEAYDPTENVWKEMAPMPTPRQHLASAVLDGILYAFGGRDSGPSTNVDATEAYDPVSDKWSVLESMPSKRGGISAVAVDDYGIFVFGGESSSQVFENNERYDPSTNSWQTVLPLPTPRHGLAATNVDGKIYIIGGGLEPTTSKPATDEVDILQIEN